MVALWEFMPIPSNEQAAGTVILITSTTESSAEAKLEDKTKLERMVKNNRITAGAHDLLMLMVKL